MMQRFGAAARQQEFKKKALEQTIAVLCKSVTVAS